MDKISENFFRDLLAHTDDLSEYVDSLYNSGDFSKKDLNYVFGYLKRQGLIACEYADNRAWFVDITFAGKHYFDDRGELMEKEYMKKEKLPLIFISHSSKNKEQVKMLAELLCSINLIPQKDIFCSSLPGYDIPLESENRIFDFLRDKFLECDIHVFFVHSSEYYASPVSLNEMGAAWVLKSRATSFLLPGFEFGDMKGVVSSDKIAIKLDNDRNEVKDKLNQLRKLLEKEFRLDPIPDVVWEDARDKFIDRINVAKKQLSEKAFDLLEKIAKVSSGDLHISEDLSLGMSIQVGEELIVSETSNRREYAIWDAALKECVRHGYLEQRNRYTYVMTQAGYEYMDRS